MARLSVNLNKIALLRNSRRTGVPDVLRFGRIAHGAGADGLTVHPRPDERHIRRADVPALANLMQPWRPACELNIEGYPDERLLELVREVRPEQCTLVPDPPGAFTSEEGWKLDNRDTPIVRPAIAALKRLGCRVILFVDPDPGAVERVPGSGADGIEYLDDPKYDDAVRVVLSTGQASASYIQRRLKLGYSRAARLIEIMEANGIVGPSQGSKPREILVRADDYPPASGQTI